MKIKINGLSIDISDFSSGESLLLNHAQKKNGVAKYFSVVDIHNHPGNNLPMKEHGYMCGDLWKGSSLCEGYNKAIFTRIFEELEKRIFDLGEKSC